MPHRQTSAPGRAARVRRAEIGRHPRSDAGDAFIPDPAGGEADARDTLAETLAELYLESATSGEEQAEEVMNQFVLEDAGGPFLDADEGEGSAEDEDLDGDGEVRAARSRR